MDWYTVEVTTAHVAADDWDLHYRAIDAVPGALLIQDAEEPMLSFPVQADDPFKAARFVAGVMKLIGLPAKASKVDPLPEPDFEAVSSDEVTEDTELTTKVKKWMDRTPELV